MNNWLILAVSAGLFSSIFNYGFRYVLKDDGDSSSFSWWFEFLRVVVILFILPFGFYVELNILTIMLLILIGLTEFISIYFYSKMHKESQLSISTIILRLRVVWIPIIAFLVMGEKLSLINYLGILIVFLGLSFISSPKKIVYDKGILLSFVCSVITAILSVMTKFLSPQVSPSIIVFAMSLPSVFLFPLFVKNWKQRAKDLYHKSRLTILMIATASVVTMYLQINALLIGTVTQVMGVFQAMSFVAVLAGIFVMGEKDNLRHKIMGSIIVIIGAYLLI